MSATCYRSPVSGWEVEGYEEWFIDEPYWRIPSTNITLCDYIGRKPMTKKKQFLSPKQQEVIREAVRASKIKMARLGEKPKVSLPTFNFMEKKDT